MANKFNSNRAYFEEVINKELDLLNSLNSNNALSKHIVSKYKLKTTPPYIREILYMTKDKRKEKVSFKIRLALYELEREKIKTLSPPERSRFIAEKYNLEFDVTFFGKQITKYERNNLIQSRKNPKL